MSRTPYGVLAQFASSEALLNAIRVLKGRPGVVLEAYTPYPVEGLAELLDATHNKVPLVTLIAGVLGGVVGYLLQWYAAVISYPINTGGRPLHSWPLFVPVTFELVILFAAVAAVLAMLLGNGLPRLHHPLFDAPEFSLASRNRFFLCVRAASRPYDVEHLWHELEALAPLSITEVRG